MHLLIALYMIRGEERNVIFFLFFFLLSQAGDKIRQV